MSLFKHNVIGKVEIDIENSKTREVKTLTLAIFEYINEYSFVFDISKLSDEEKKI